MNKIIVLVICSLCLIVGIVLLAIFIKPKENKHENKVEDDSKIENQEREFNPNDTPKPQIKSAVNNDFSVLDKWRSYTRPKQVNDTSRYKRNLQKLELPVTVEEIICKPDLYPGNYVWNEKFPKHDTIKMYRDTEYFYILNTTQGLAFIRNIKSNNVINTFTL
jgi:hypothetical protein